VARRLPLTVVAVAAAAILLAGCGGGGDDTGPAPTTGTGTTAGTATASGPQDAVSVPFEEPKDPATVDVRRKLTDEFMAYVAAINRRDGAALCRHFAPGALHGVSLPVNKGNCAASISASIGHTLAGHPRWRRSSVSRVRTALAGSASGRVTFTVFHRYTAGEEVSKEEDVVFFVRAAGRWVLAKPSVTFYRAIGAADVPPSVLSPPAGD
jgi:hypothetical protein